MMNLTGVCHGNSQDQVNKFENPTQAPQPVAQAPHPAARYLISLIETV